MLLGDGMAIVSAAEKMDWLLSVYDLVYWGDCDGKGYLVLDRLRHAAWISKALGSMLESEKAGR